MKNNVLKNKREITLKFTLTKIKKCSEANKPNEPHLLRWTHLVLSTSVCNLFRLGVEYAEKNIAGSLAGKLNGILMGY